MAEQKKRAMAGPDRSSKRRKVGFEIALLVRLRYMYTSYSCSTLEFMGLCFTQLNKYVANLL